MKMYNNAGYAAERLIGTIVKLKTGDPIFIDNIVNGVVDYQLLYDEEEDGPYQCKLDALDIEPVRLGFVRTHYGYSYICRIPKREDWRQGLRANTMRSRDGIVAPEEIGWFSLYECIKGIYPNLSDCGDGVAFHRDFKITKEGKINYKDKWDIGYFTNKEEKRYTLFENSMWARESLEEALRNV
jgi:hypothetical protein